MSRNQRLNSTETSGRSRHDWQTRRGQQGKQKIMKSLMMSFCYTHRPVTCPVVIWEASSRRRRKWAQIPTGKPSSESLNWRSLSSPPLRDQGIPWRRERKIQESEGICDTQRTCPPNLSSHVLTDVGSMGPAWVYTRTSTCRPWLLAWCLLGLLTVQMSYLWLFCLTLRLISSYWVALPSVNIKTFASPYCIWFCPVCCHHLEACSFLKRKWSKSGSEGQKRYRRKREERRVGETVVGCTVLYIFLIKNKIKI